MRILFMALALLIACYTTVSCTNSQKKSEEPNIGPMITSVSHIEVQGHRGARGRYPENSLAAFEYAISIGVDVLELDLNVSKDGQLVISHDPNINPELCVGPQGERIKDKLPIYKLTLAEIKKYSCGMLPYPKYPKQKKMKVGYSTLRELFEMVKNSKLPGAKTVGFNIETKIIPGEPEASPRPGQFAADIISLLHEYGFAPRSTLQSFDHRTLVESKKIDPTLRISPLIENTLFTNLPLMAKDLHAEIISPNLYWITKNDVDALHKIGVRVIPWTADEEREWAMLISLGVDGIISDYPEELIAYLKSKGLR